MGQVDLSILTAEDARNLLVVLKRTTCTGTDEARVLIILEEKLKNIFRAAAPEAVVAAANEEPNGEDTSPAN